MLKRTLLATAATVAIVGSANAGTMYVGVGIQGMGLFSPSNVNILKEDGTSSYEAKDLATKYTNFGFRINTGGYIFEDLLSAQAEFNYFHYGDVTSNTSVEKANEDKFKVKKTGEGEEGNEDITASYKTSVDYGGSFNGLAVSNLEFKYDFVSLKVGGGIGLGYPTAKVTLSPDLGERTQPEGAEEPKSIVYETDGYPSYSIAAKGGVGLGFDLAEGVSFNIDGHYYWLGTLNDTMVREDTKASISTDKVLPDKSPHAIVFKAGFTFNF